MAAAQGETPSPQPEHRCTAVHGHGHVLQGRAAFPVLQAIYFCTSLAGDGVIPLAYRAKRFTGCIFYRRL